LTRGEKPRDAAWTSLIPVETCRPHLRRLIVTPRGNPAATISPPAAAARAGGLLHLPLGLALAQRGALVVQLLAAGQADLDLDAAALEVDLQGDDRQALLGRLADHAGDLTLVEQQLAVALRLVIGVGAVT